MFLDFRIKHQHNQDIQWMWSLKVLTVGLKVLTVAHKSLLAWMWSQRLLLARVRPRASCLSWVVFGSHI